MKLRATGLAPLLIVAMIAGFCEPALAYEFGFPGWFQKPGLTLGVTAANPPPGIYSFNEMTAALDTTAGPGASPGAAPRVGVAGDAVGFSWVPGWTFLGASYDAALLQPFLMVDIGQPFGVQQAGMHNTYVVPAELSWK